MSAHVCTGRVQFTPDGGDTSSASSMHAGRKALAVTNPLRKEGHARIALRARRLARASSPGCPMPLSIHGYRKRRVCHVPVPGRVRMFILNFPHTVVGDSSTRWNDTSRLPDCCRCVSAWRWPAHLQAAASARDDRSVRAGVDSRQIFTRLRTNICRLIGVCQASNSQDHLRLRANAVKVRSRRCGVRDVELVPAGVNDWQASSLVRSASACRDFCKACSGWLLVDGWL